MHLFYPFYKQDSESTCGVYCIAMILKYYHIQFNLSTIKEISRVDARGITVHSLVQSLSHYGVRAEAKRGNYDELILESDLPMIANIVTSQGLSHFVVIYKMHPKYVLIADPANRIIKMKKDQFIKEWTGLVVTTHKHKVYNEQLRFSLGSFIQDIIAHQLSLILLISVTSLILVILQLVIGSYQKLILNELAQDTSLIKILLVTAMISTIIISYFLLNNLKMTLKAHLDFKIDMNYFIEYQTAYLKKDQSFFDQQSPADLLVREQYLNYIKEFISSIITFLFVDGLIIIILITYLWIKNPMLLLISIIGMGLKFIFNFVFKRYRKMIEDQVLNKSLEMQNIYIATIWSHQTIRYRSLQGSIKQKLKLSTIKSLLIQQRKRQLIIFIQGFGDLINQGLSILIILYALLGVMNTKWTLATSTFYIFIVQMLIGVVSTYVQMIEDYPLVIRGVRHLEHLATDDEVNKYDLTMIKEIKVVDLVFSYGHRRPIISHFNYTFNHHHLIAGPSGSSKSTIVKLLVGDYTTYQGMILYNGQDAKCFISTQIKSKIGYLNQFVELLPGTILDNLCCFNDEYVSRVFKVIEYLELENFFYNEVDLKMEIQQGTTLFSSGQNQLLGIVRFLVNNYDVIILDEALCHLDHILEQKILHKIIELYKDRVMIVISHRLSRIEGFRVLQMIKGGIIIE